MPKFTLRGPCALRLLAVVAGLSLSCSKDLPSSPATPAGTPVIVNGNYRIGASRNIVFENGTVKNQSGVTIYDVRVALVVWRNAPYDAEFTDTSAILFTSIDHGVTSSKFSLQVMGDAFLGAIPVYEILPP